MVELLFFVTVLLQNKVEKLAICVWVVNKENLSCHSSYILNEKT